MAIIRPARYGDQTTTEMRDGKVTKKFTQVLDVELEATDPDPISGLEVTQLNNAPRPGFSVYVPRPGLVVPFATCRTVTPAPVQGNRRRWTLTCTFEKNGNDDEPKPDSSDPNSLLPIVEPFSETGEAVMLEDFDGTKILDPFGDLFDEPMRVPIPIDGVKVTRYVPTYDESTLSNWLETTNKTEWRNQPEDAWCVTAITGQPIQFGNFTIGQINLTIKAHPLELKVSLKGAAPKLHRIGWLGVRAARSTTFLDDDGKRQTNRADGGANPPLATWVDKDGKKSEEPYFQAFRVRRQREFSAIA
ncbi:hypothetical protein [Allorhodopirellula heiligendammensis]|uniref:Uncharacterized protein n=1 Tax=Allorhodopirellula heiligendammensis TaxID=2714739 RepID=A0A5C6C5Y7_9BACT|nr:hypothetical protein [Allorhodopirellula heiligendammensis]TWU19568.1 hypothetical protein Poly21_17420 [Allorhodopirellula heiligendammensis]